ncbi:aspartic peptidase domain-containing protein [Suillus spraguei]|nr:aspartic peptidase domain-containing protein [Suillus spraguei]
MFPTISLLPIFLLALSITGSPVEVRKSPITLLITRRLNVSNGTVNILQHDKARVAALRDSSKHGRYTDNTPVTNSFEYYTAEVGVGSPPTTYNLIVDTGSSNTWIGASTKYVVTRTSINTGQPVAVGYGSGFFSGTEYLDTVTIGSGVTITNQSIGVAATASGFATGIDGILGIGPVDLTEGTLTNLPTTTIPTVTDDLYKKGSIPQDIISIFFQPSSSQTESDGELTFGGTDATKYTGEIAYTALTSTMNPASEYWGINESITYGSTTILSSTAGIVDTGTTFLYIASDAYTKYQSATSASVDAATGLLLVSSAQYNALKNLNFHIGSKTYSLTPNGQIWPRSLNSHIGGGSNAIYLIINDIGTPSGQGFDFIDGYTFLQRFYSVFDTAKSRVGFATTEFTDATTN